MIDSDDTIRDLRVAYRDSIASMADTVRGNLRADPTLDLYDEIHTMADGCTWVIYTAQAMLVPYLSDTDPLEACEEAGGASTSNPMLWSVLAYHCVRGDLASVLDGFDPEEKA